MATIKSALKLYDGMTPALRSITTAMNVVINSFETMKSASDDPINTSAIQEARRNLAEASVEINNIENNLEQAGREQDSYTRKTQRTTQAMNGLQAAVLGVVSAAAFKKVLDLSDTITQNKARLDLMNDGLQSTEELQNRIYASAQRTRGSYNDMAASVSKLGILAGEAFNNNDEQIAFVELMNKQFTIGGSSIQEQTSAMYQLTQAMAAGKLQGDEYRSIMENAPLLARAIATELGVGVGELKNMSSQGLITSDVIKNAMFNSAADTNAMFNEMPWTWAQVWTTVLNSLQNTFAPFLDFLGRAATWVGENWSVIEPVLLGIAAAIGIVAAALLLYKTYTAIATVVQWAMNSALFACPITWIVLLIAVLIGALVWWIVKVGGVKVAWLIAMNAIKTAWDYVVIGFLIGVFAIMKFLMKMKLAWLKARNAIVGFILDMGVGVLNGLQAMINGAIGLLNGFIETLNKIPGVSIEAIKEVTFATEAAMTASLKKEEMAAAVSEQEAKNAAFEEFANTYIDQYKTNALAAREERLAEIAEAQAANEGSEHNIFDSIQSGGGGAAEATAGNTGAIADNTEDIRDSVDLANEELKYLRELAEQEAINKFTTAEIHIETRNENHISSDMDIDGVVDEVTEKLEEAILAAAEGDHDV